jgi:hypothetical protein
LEEFAASFFRMEELVKHGRKWYRYRKSENNTGVLCEPTGIKNSEKNGDP